MPRLCIPYLLTYLRVANTSSTIKQCHAQAYLTYLLVGATSSTAVGSLKPWSQCSSVLLKPGSKSALPFNLNRIYLLLRLCIPYLLTDGKYGICSKTRDIASKNNRKRCPTDNINLSSHFASALLCFFNLNLVSIFILLTLVKRG